MRREYGRCLESGQRHALTVRATAPHIDRCTGAQPQSGTPSLYYTTMANFEARLKPEHRLRYPELNISSWYEVVPLFPGLTERRLNMRGERVARLRVGKSFLEVMSEHVEFRSLGPQAALAQGNQRR